MKRIKAIKMWCIKKKVFFLIFLLYLIPLFLQVQFDDAFHIKRIYLGLPGVLSGDEPHYLIVTTSLINDYDFYVQNNYDNAAFSGGCDGGNHFKNQSKMGRHMLLYSSERKVVASINPENQFNLSTYEQDLGKISEAYNATDFRQVNQRPLGLPLFSMIFLWPLKNTCMIEPFAILLTVIMSLSGVYFFYLICEFYVKKYQETWSIGDDDTERYSQLFTVIFALCTPFWHYSKTYFVEPYLAMLLLGAYYFFIVKRQSVLPGFFLGVGLTMKYPFGIYGLLFGILLLYKKEWKRSIYFGLGSMVPVSFILYTNWFFTGSLFSFPRAEYLSFFDHYITGIGAALFHPNFGLIPFAPFILFSGVGFWTLYKYDKESLFHFILVIVPYFLFWSSLALTEVGGGGGYASRYDVPLLGFFVLLSMIWYVHSKNNFLKKLFLGAVILSFIVNAQAAFLYFLFWETPPWELILHVITKFERIKELVLASLGFL